MPMEKMDKLYLDEFLAMKYNRMADEKDVEKEKERFAALKEYATEIELREVINRKVFMLKNLPSLVARGISLMYMSRWPWSVTL